MLQVGRDRLHEVAMGQGQSEVALQLLRECAKTGGDGENACRAGLPCYSIDMYLTVRFGCLIHCVVASLSIEHSG
jgi:hypothetical protein